MMAAVLAALLAASAPPGGLADAPAGLAIVPALDGQFLTAWGVSGPARGKRPPSLERGAWRAVTSPLREVDAGRQGRPGKGEATWFALILESDRDQDLHLKLGSDGAAAVWLDGEVITRHEKTHYALWDDHVHRFPLSAGRHRVVIETRRKKKQRNSGWKIVCRIQDARTARVPDGLRFLLPLDAPPKRIAARASQLRFDRHLTRDGFGIRVALELTGSHPPSVTLTPKVTLDGKPIRNGPVALRDGRHTLVVTAGGERWTEVFEHRKAWNSGLLDAREAFGSIPPGTQNKAALESLEYNMRKLRTHVLESIPDHAWLTKQIQRVRSWALAAAAGRDPWEGLRGDFYRAYRSRYDTNLQPYSVHVPSRYDGRRKWPLVIGMHGIGSGTHYTLRRVLGKDRDKEGGEPGGKPLIRGNMPNLPDYGVLTASAWGYHNSAFWFYGEDDVLRVIDEMKAQYNVDADRVYLTGLSLGGLGTYHIGHHFPDVFAALGPLGGFSSVKLYRQIRNHPKTRWEVPLIEQRDATTYAANGRHTPMRVVHGRRDGPRHAKAMTDRYQKLGYRHELEIPELGHDVWQHAYGGGALVKWMKRWRRPSAPDEVVFETRSYRYVRAYWARIGWIEAYPWKLARLKVRVDSKDRSRILVHRAESIRGLTLDLTEPKMTRGPVRIVFRSTGQTLEVPKRAVVHLRRDRGSEGRWRLADSAAPPAGWKRPGTSGPLDDVMYEPHTFVVGTSDPAQVDVNRRLASEDHMYLRHRNHDIGFPTVDDVDTSDADLREHNLVLIGNPRSNSALARVLATGKVPLAFEEGALVVGGQRYEGEDVGVKMIVPNPFNDKRYVVICAGVTWQGTLLSRYLPRFVPDVIVYDRRIATRYLTRILIDRPVRYAAFFEPDWTLPR